MNNVHILFHRRAHVQCYHMNVITYVNILLVIRIQTKGMGVVGIHMRESETIAFLVCICCSSLFMMIVGGCSFLLLCNYSNGLSCDSLLHY